MNNATERIKGYCTEVNQAQWEELVRVAHANGVTPTEYDYWDVSYNVFCINEEENTTNGYADTELARREGLTAIPFPDFIAKLRGVEEWMPKEGEMVEVEVGKLNPTWVKAEMVCVHKGYYICNEVNNWQYLPFKLNQIRPIRPTITRAEAEQQLGKRIIG